MDIRELPREAVRALQANKLRSFLTLLGIIIGVATLVGVVSVISGLNVYVREKVFALSPDVFILTRFGIIRSRDEFLDALKRRKIDGNDFATLARTLQQSEVAAQVDSPQAVKAGTRRLPDINLNGTTANYGPMMRLDIQAGRYFTDAEALAAQPVAVIGWDVKDELYPNQDPIGRTILVAGRPFEVIGLLAKQGRALGQSRDNNVLIPFKAYTNAFGAHDNVDLFLRAYAGVEAVPEAVDEARSVMRALRHTDFRAPDPIGVVTAESLQELWQQISAAAFILALLISSVSLGVGGIVIMNIMLVAVVERTKEIGVRLALGARKRDIRRQFLLEAALLALGGGVAGVALGAAGAYGVQNVLDFPARFTPPIAAAGIALAIVVGIVAGYWPARAASNLPVVEALRTD